MLAFVNYHEMEERIRADYRAATAQYRRDDEVEVRTANHRRLCGVLKDLCLSFSHPVAVLDAGCGTGRYFHCLENISRLVGMDISEDMLAAAASPVLEEEISVQEIELMRANVFLASFPPASFDLIYSLGMFGNGCPVTVEICHRFHDWLRPGGKILFNVVDAAGLQWCHRTRRRLKSLVYPRLTKRWQRALDERAQRSPFFALTRDELTDVLTAAPFSGFSIASQDCDSPLWNGRHLECIARKA
jgi:SAM-dependent methyltransferase